MKTFFILVFAGLLASCADPDPSKLLCHGKVYVADPSKNEDTSEVIVECDNHQQYKVYSNKSSLNVKRINQ